MPSFQAEITKHLNKLADVCESHNPDKKHNTGRQLGVVYFWSMVEKLAKAKKEDAWKYLIDNKIAADTENLDPGDYALAESPHFYASAKVSQPVKRFDESHLQAALKKKYKVPELISKELIADAKQPTKSTVTKSVIER